MLAKCAPSVADYHWLGCNEVDYLISAVLYHTIVDDVVSLYIIIEYG